MNRRGFLTSILAAGAAPFVVRAESLMAVRVPESGLLVSLEAASIYDMILYGVLKGARDEEALREMFRQKMAGA